MIANLDASGYATCHSRNREAGRASLAGATSKVIRSVALLLLGAVDLDIGAVNLDGPLTDTFDQ